MIGAVSDTTSTLVALSESRGGVQAGQAVAVPLGALATARLALREAAALVEALERDEP
jgi:hypothetical protein